LVAVAGFLLLAFASYAPSQVTSMGGAAMNLMGVIGAYTAHLFILSWGVVAYYLPLLCLGYAVAIWREHELDRLGRRLTGAVLLVPVLCGLVHLIPASAMRDALLGHWDQMQFYGMGGTLGRMLCAPPRPYDQPDDDGGLLIANLDTVGSFLVLALLAIVCLWLMRIGIRRYLRRVWNAVHSWKQAPPLEMPERPNRVKGPFMAGPSGPMVKNRATTSINQITRRIADEAGATPPDAQDLIERIRHQKRALEQMGSITVGEPAPAAGPASSPPPADAPPPAAAPEGAADPLPPGRPTAATEVEPRSATKREARPAAEPDTGSASSRPATVARPATRKVTREKTSAAPDAYVLPPVDLLDAKPESKVAEHEQEMGHISCTIEDVFAQFAIGVKVVGRKRGPVVTQYEINLLDQAMRVGKVEGFEKDLSMKLGTEGIRIVAPLPNKTTIGIEVPNKIKEAVVMRDLVEEIELSSMALPLILGRDVIGRPLVGDLARMPHLLVAGATGMGKSVCMNSMICSILLFKSPDEVKFILIDPKMVELAGYEDIPHLLAAPITDMTKAHAALEWACRTMDERYEALRLVGVRDIRAFNELGEDEIRFRLAKKEVKLEELPGNGTHMPYIVILVDEYADLMMMNKEVEKAIVRLAAKSRACGIHVILTTQRPSADVVTGLIKANLPCRICFRVVDKSNSRVVLDISGAENLLGKGDMLYLQPGTAAPVRGQGVWMKDEEINAIIEHAKAQGRPTYDEEIIKVGAIALLGGGSGGGRLGSEWLDDRQFHEAVQAMYRYNRSGADFFRRKLGVGYNRATEYVERLEDLGFLGPQKGTASREIIKTWDDWIELLKDHNVTWDEDDELYRNPVEVSS
jgi:S-DNA-T family DNA segregation ATPase FtsK/SpoIIIE